MFLLFSTDEYWLDIGLKEDYEKANNDIKIKNHED